MTELSQRPVEVHVGPWEPERDLGYSAHDRQWILRRRNSRWPYGTEPMLTASCSYRRWGSEAAARKHAKAENGKHAKTQNEPCTDSA